jgi:hypothetical protein
MYVSICLSAWIECVIGFPSMKDRNEYVYETSQVDGCNFSLKKVDIKIR